jgi:hypothetical protein
MASEGKCGVRSKIILNEIIHVEQIPNLKYLGCKITILNAQEDIKNKLKNSSICAVLWDTKQGNKRTWNSIKPWHCHISRTAMKHGILEERMKDV